MKLKKQLVRFIIVGLIATAIDAIAYSYLIHADLLSPSNAKRVSFVVGSVWAYLMHKFFTFEQKKLRSSEPIRFTIVYLFGWILNSATHDVVLAGTGLESLAFVIATGCSTCSNFVGQKWLVFRIKPQAR
ncbi:MAG: hypothetical protein CUN55_18570 [Phototrophicales bacterium]|nr:MAG: hypothetical protein CUN55_18570 [Phototrophicales bacterium]